MMGALFHNYKKLLQLSGTEKLSEDSILKQGTKWERDKPLTKALFDKTYERWRGLLYAVHRDDREHLLKMLVDCCDSLGDGMAKVIIERSLENTISVFFLFCLVFQNQRLINEIKNFTEKNVKAEVNLLDFIDRQD
jgi:hypothetical protein